MDEIICKRCGQCCYLLLRGKVSTVKCPYLWVSEEGKWTKCRRWNDRNKAIQDGKLLYITLGNKCIERRNGKFDFEGCPYNTDKPIIKVKVRR